MPFEVKTLPELSAIRIRLWDKVTAAELRSLAAGVIELAKLSGLRRALVDCRDYLGGAGLREVFLLTQDVTDRPASQRGSEAIIAPSDPYVAADVQFYVETARRLGTNVRMFDSHEAAVAWLIAGDGAGHPTKPAHGDKAGMSPDGKRPH